MTPSEELYGETFTTAYRFFNEHLFADGLPECVITVQRGKNYLGFFAPKRWKSPAGQYAHELAMNTSYFNEQTLMQILQTLVHEQVHLWQEEYGKPSRSGYHNKEWARKMESIGLMPSSTHAPGGKKTGHHMGDYPISGGLFEEKCIQLIQSGFNLKWIDRSIIRHRSPRLDILEEEPEITIDQDEGQTNILALLYEPIINKLEFDPIAPQPKDTSKQKYTCGCGSNVWGKGGLLMQCKKCGKDFAPRC